MSEIKMWKEFSEKNFVDPIHSSKNWYQFHFQNDIFQELCNWGLQIRLRKWFLPIVV